MARSKSTSWKRPKPQSVFISHSSKDSETAKAICAAIERRGMGCWLSSLDVGPGENFQESIHRAIGQTRVMVLVFSQNANNSDEIKKEIALAGQHRLVVIPLRIEDVLPSSAFAYELATRQWINLFEDWDAAIDRLIDQLQKVLAAAPAAQPAGVLSAASASVAVVPAAAPQGGMGRVGLVAGLVVALLLAGGGFYVWRSDQEAKRMAAEKAEIARLAAETAKAAADRQAAEQAAAEEAARKAAAEKLAAEQAAAVKAAVEEAARKAAAEKLAVEQAAAVKAAIEEAARKAAAEKLAAEQAAAAKAAADEEARRQATEKLAAEKLAAEQAEAARLAAAKAQEEKLAAEKAAAEKAAAEKIAAEKATAEKALAQTQTQIAPPVQDRPQVAALEAPRPPPPETPPEPAILETAPALAEIGAGGQVFRDCRECPHMVAIGAGSAVVGSPPGEAGRTPNEGPQQKVAFAKPFAVGRFDVTFEEWDACVAAGGCNHWQPGDYGWGRGKQPVIFVSWDDARAYADWLSAKTGQRYRLMSEAEYEYVARACRTADCAGRRFWFGDAIRPEYANYNSQYSYDRSPKAQARRRTLAVNASPANPFGLYHIHGNVRRWMADCWNPSLEGLPADGSARMTGDCHSHVLRGGGWSDAPGELRASARSWEDAKTRNSSTGFRLARDLAP